MTAAFDSSFFLAAEAAAVVLALVLLALAGAFFAVAVVAVAFFLGAGAEAFFLLAVVEPPLTAGLASDSDFVVDLRDRAAVVCRNAGHQTYSKHSCMHNIYLGRGRFSLEEKDSEWVRVSFRPEVVLHASLFTHLFLGAGSGSRCLLHSWLLLSRCRCSCLNRRRNTGEPRIRLNVACHALPSSLQRWTSWCQ